MRMQIGYNEKHFTINGKPWFPIMGEYEYSRTERSEWKRGIAKMKALGLNAVQSYVIWLHHEEIKGRFNFRGNNNLRAFIRLVKEADMKMCLRIGPWVHAELRNGGFPDWIYEQGYKPRTNDPSYLADVETYFKEIYKQCKGYFSSEGGPIFSIQVENEFRRHTAGSIDEGERHISILIDMMRKIGFDVPIYFATGWGNAVTGEAIPTWGEYAAQPWEQNTDELPPNVAYIIGSNPNEVPVGEYKERPTALGSNLRAKTNVPYMTVEQGSGNQPTHLRRPIVTARDNGAMTFCRLAQGLVGLGYYVFHGGINQVGALSTTQEYRAEEFFGVRDGCFCDLAELNYDFQGAVSMYNRVSETGRELKIWNTVCSEFSEFFCKADVTLGEGNATDPADVSSPRYSVRKYGESTLVFYNNYARRQTLPDRKVIIPEDLCSVGFPDTVIRSGESVIYPFGLRFGDNLLEYATATPLCVLNNDTLVIFSYDGKADYRVKGSGRVLVISYKDALNSYKIRLDGTEYLVITDSEIIPDDYGGYYMEYSGAPSIKTYPRLENLEGFVCVGEDKEFILLEPDTVSDASVGIALKESEAKAEYKEYTVKLAYDSETLYDAFIKVDFNADLAEIYIDGEKVNDMLYTGIPFEIGMRYHGFPHELTVRLYPLEEDREIYLERKPIYENGSACSLNSIEVTAMSKMIFSKEQRP